MVSLCFSFNSRARKGRDVRAELKGKNPDSFNSRARKGRDQCQAMLDAAVSAFQFTRP